MSYIGQRIARRRNTRVVRKIPMQGLGGVLDFLGAAVSPLTAISDVFSSRTVADQTACVAQADQITTALDAKWYGIAQNWNPTGRFSPSDMNAAVAATIKTLSDAQVAVMFAPQSASDAGMMISQSLGELNDKLKAAAQYTAAVGQAQSTGATVIDSPGFKNWITSSLVVASGAFATRAILDCNVSWLQKASDYMDQVWAVVSKIVDVAIKAGETAINVVDDTLSAYTYIKWGAVALAAYWLLTKVKKSANA